MYPQIPVEWFGTKYILASYPLFALLGAVMFLFAILPFFIREGLSWFRYLIFINVWIATFLMGARGLNFLVNRQAYVGSLQLHSFYFGGFSLYGGALGVLFATFILARLFRIQVWNLLDHMIIPSSLAVTSARIGCFLAGCCAGKATDSFWGVVFPNKEAAASILEKLSPLLPRTEIAVYPTQLFEAGGALIGLAVVLIYCKLCKPISGVRFLLYAIMFTGMRLLMLPIGNLPYSDMVVQVFYPVFYTVLILLGVSLYHVRMYSKGDSVPH
jgi:phosphatidylglycerol:prolipoprotein diacylglycerol transferase